MSDKPSRNEDEYFAKQEAELLKAQKAEAEKAKALEERKSHFMKCPKCGADLVVEEFHGLEVDRCPECNGIWFDAGEAEQVIKDEPEGMLASTIGALVRGLGGGKTKSAE
ncbi:MAG: zf-TFIIB domain-containing protein [Gemmatimonadota bacterium]|nr:zf-TFIIB domain-containing protein [Gemmatimonadota bacterium]